MSNYYDAKKLLKKGLLFLLVAGIPMLVICVVLTIYNTPFWLNLIVTILVGGAFLLLCYFIDYKRNEKKKEQDKKKYDPFRD